MIYKVKVCLYMLSLVHALMYAACEGSKEKNLVAGWYFHGDKYCVEVAFTAPSSKWYGAGCAGRRVAYA